MEIKELNEILELKDNGKIKKAIKEHGFFNASKSKDLKEFPLMDIIKGTANEEANETENEKFIFTAVLCDGVKGAEQYQFIWYQASKKDYKRDIALPCDLCIFAKEKNSERV